MIPKKKSDKYSGFILTALAAIALALIFYKIYMFKLAIPDRLAVQMTSAIQGIATQNVLTVNKMIIIDIAGEIKKPGVYKLVQGARIVDLIRDAGGVISGADLTQINLAAPLVDGQKILIPCTNNDKNNSVFTEARSNPALHSSGTSKININSAGISDLEKIPGIGKKYAQNILEIRKAAGRINSYDEIGKIKGIGPKRMEKIKAASTL